MFGAKFANLTFVTVVLALQLRKSGRRQRKRPNSNNISEFYVFISILNAMRTNIGRTLIRKRSYVRMEVARLVIELHRKLRKFDQRLAQHENGWEMIELSDKYFFFYMNIYRERMRNIAFYILYTSTSFHRNDWSSIFLRRRYLRFGALT